MSLHEASNGNGSKDWSFIAGNIDGLAGYEPMFRRFANAGGFGSPLSGFLATIERSPGIGGPFHLNPDFSKEVEAELRSFIAPNGADSVVQIHDALLRYEVGKFLPSLLQVEDRVTMAYGLESRVPLLDLAVVEFVLGLPLNVRLGGTRPKDLMRKAAAQDLPAEVLERKDKMGFPVPLNAWARGTGKIRVKAALESLAERDLEFVDNSAIRGIVSSQDLASRNLWAALSLESWLAAN
ncbi:asparagine synthetase 1 [mine drainage metagenome]|uniref:Asparagine synthetase 1 n=1 Tax=mine drainage metagenome TaxID=410659 RepID=A0A1J5P9F0_9ZZZZ